MTLIGVTIRNRSGRVLTVPSARASANSLSRGECIGGAVSSEAAEGVNPSCSILEQMNPRNHHGFLGTIFSLPSDLLVSSYLSAIELLVVPATLTAGMTVDTVPGVAKGTSIPVC